MRENVHFSTDVSAFLPEGKYKSLAKHYQALSPAKEVFLAVEGLDEQAFSTVKSLEKAMLDSGFFILWSHEEKNPHLLDYLDRYRYFIQNFTPRHVEAQRALESLVAEMASTPFYHPIDTKDPFGFFSSLDKPSAPSLHRGHATLGEIGYFSLFYLKPEVDELEAYYFLQELEKEGIYLFSPLFYFVENARNIQKDVNWLLAASIFLLCLIYLVVLKNTLLFVNTFATLATSVLVALGGVSVVWGEVSVFALAFGVAVSSVGVDYMFHHYFHHHYATKKPFNRAVLWGFLTTASLFALFLSVDFLLVQQLSLFALIALMVAYVHFALLYPRLGFGAPLVRTFPRWKTYPVKHRYVVVGALAVLGVAWPWLELDANVRHLDYHNEKRLSDEAFFKAHLPSGGYVPFVLEAQNSDALIAHSRRLKADFPQIQLPFSLLLDTVSFQERKEALLPLLNLHGHLQEAAEKVGFKRDFFKDAYTPSLLAQTYPAVDIATLQGMGFEVVKTAQGYLTRGYAPQRYRAALEAREGVYIIEANTLFSKALEEVFKHLFWLGLAGMVLLLGMVWLACRARFVHAFAYIVFPLAVVAVVFTQFSLSVMHLFMVFVVLALSVDYGIYIARVEGAVVQTRSAIVFSLLSTCAGFGVLAWSEVGALRDLGVVACLGVVAIGVLLWGGERDANCGGC